MRAGTTNARCCDVYILKGFQLMNYYNDNDEDVCRWLSNLMGCGHIPCGHIDNRPIQDVKASDILGFTQCHFFAGIGGWPLALMLAGMSDVKGVWTASCPCQPFSNAGKGLGEKDERHLWPSLFNLVRECRPSIVFGEQVASPPALQWVDGVFSDLEGEGYACGAADLCAASVGAPHIRQRLYWVGHANDARPQGRNSQELCECSSEFTSRQTGSPVRLANTYSAGPQQGNATTESNGQGRPFVTESEWCKYGTVECLDGKHRRVPVEPTFFPLAYGIPKRVVRLRGYGNSIVPQVAAQFILSAMESI